MDANRKSPQHEGSADRRKGPRVSTRRGTGPRTLIGKGRSKYNALRHGLFAKTVVLSQEPDSEFVDLHCALQNDLKLEGTLQEILVEKLGVILWRYRRPLESEGGAVLKNIQEIQVEKNRSSIAQHHALALAEQECRAANYADGLFCA